MSILNIFNSKNKAEKSTEQSDTTNTKRIDNTKNILDFKNSIKKVVEEQKNIKKITRNPHTTTDAFTLAQSQSTEIENRKWLYKAYTAYYIVKHYLWVNQNNEKREAYLKKVVEEAKRAFKTDRTDKDKWLVENFLDKVDNFVNAYIPNE